ncbi:hypothetical protein FPK51_30595, partial [Acinetobacter baumannii]|nr:hypothetical protein [Acinetobacter baumannii]
LGGSAACASAQNQPASIQEGAGAGAIQEAVCGPDCLAELQLVARSETVPVAPSIFMRESASESESDIAHEREQQAAFMV